MSRTASPASAPRTASEPADQNQPQAADVPPSEQLQQAEHGDADAD